MNLDAVIRHYRLHFQPNARAELASFRNEETVEAAVQRAALAETPGGQRYAHQRRLQRPNLERAATALSSKVTGISAQPNFARLFELVERTLRSERGLGDLYIYDTALRIGAKVGHLPARVYLHAGARTGALALGLDATRRPALDTSELPPEFRVMEMHEVEDILCIYKRHFAGEVLDIEDARACWADEQDERD